MTDPSLAGLLDGYGVAEGRYDEMREPAGEPRPHWSRFLADLASRSGAEVSETLSMLERDIRENGVTYNVYADPLGADRPWEVDPVPLMLPPEEWAQIESGIAQRAELLNRVLGDIYGPQQLLRSGAIPPSVVFGHSGYLHQVRGIVPPGGCHLFMYAADLARSPDGHWWVVGDRTQAPSGAGYALENRLVVSHVFPRMFRDLHVQHLASFFATMRESLLRWAPRGEGEAGSPLVALLTPGPYNETYFEHALIARYLGLHLVEGSDLTVREGCVWLKTVEGLKRVHAVLRRQDDDYCDPLELRSDSALGVPGLTDCARRGTVMIANALGSGIIESGALLGYLPRLSERLLGEPLRLPSVATWWLGEPAAFEDAWTHLEQLVIKPLDRTSRTEVVFGADLSADEQLMLKARVAAHPGRYVAQERVRQSQAPVLRPAGFKHAASAGRLGARTIGLRVFAVATPEGYRVMPGGLTRVAGAEDARMLAMQRGGGSKDTWVLSHGPVNASFSLLAATIKPQDLVSSRVNLPSRAAENLYWYGRYSERCDGTARLLRTATNYAISDAERREDGLRPLLALARLVELVPDDGDPAAELVKAATLPDEGLGAQLRQLSRVAFNMRDRMSIDHWRAINQLVSDPVFQREATMSVALNWLDRAVTSMTTISGYVLDGMTRSTGWRFLSMGRRIERLLTLCRTLRTATQKGQTSGLDWLLELSDSTITYHSRYVVAPEWLPVLHLLLRDEVNPRSVAFQLKGLVDFTKKVEAVHGPFGSEVLAPVLAAFDALRAEDLDPESRYLAHVLVRLEDAAHQLSDKLTLKFFSHADSRSLLSLVS